MLGSPPPPWQARKVRPRLLASAVIAALCLPVLDPGVQLFWRDTQRFFYPFKLLLAQRLRNGELPLWDPWTEAGVSVLGQLTPGLWHPATLLYLLPFPVAFKLNHLIALTARIASAFSLKLSNQLRFVDEPVPGFERTDTITSAALVVGFSR